MWGAVENVHIVTYLVSNQPKTSQMPCQKQRLSHGFFLLFPILSMVGFFSCICVKSEKCILPGKISVEHNVVKLERKAIWILEGLMALVVSDSGKS